MNHRQLDAVERAKGHEPPLRRSPCLRHPDWQGEAGKPDPPAGSCPHCQAEAMEARPYTPDPPRILDAEPPAPLGHYELMEEALDKYPDHRPGGGLTREQEARALEQIEVAREREREEIERKRNRAPVGMPGARLVNERYQHGRLFQWYAVPGRNGLIEVTR